MSNISPLEHKISIIAKEIDTGFESYTRHFAQRATLRGWTITLALAYMGFLISIKSNNFLAVLPFAIVLLLFMYIESGEIATMALDGSEVREVEKIFMESDPTKFTVLIQQYEFRDIRLHKQQPSGIRGRIARLKYMLSLGMIAWYSFLLLLVLATYTAIVLRII
ncbi:MAG: hypothetical protein HZC40_03380 [Chloroflexi bacterium]|nr:hypothetical protein [Chloroflexota bacterium]